MGFKRRAVEKLGIPPESALNSLRVVVVDEYCYVENHSGIAKYTSEEIAVRLGNRLLRVMGEGLTIDHIHVRDIKICGKVNSITFEGGKT